MTITNCTFKYKNIKNEMKTTQTKIFLTHFKPDILKLSYPSENCHYRRLPRLLCPFITGKLHFSVKLYSFVFASQHKSLNIAHNFTLPVNFDRFMTFLLRVSKATLSDAQGWHFRNIVIYLLDFVALARSDVEG